MFEILTVLSSYWVIIIPAFVMSQIEPLFIFNRRTFVRESSARIYSPYVFAIGQLLGEIPYSFACGIVYWLLMVYPQNFGQGAAGLEYVRNQPHADAYTDEVSAERASSSLSSCS